VLLSFWSCTEHKRLADNRRIGTKFDAGALTETVLFIGIHISMESRIVFSLLKAGRLNALKVQHMFMKVHISARQKRKYKYSCLHIYIYILINKPKICSDIYVCKYTHKYIIIYTYTHIYIYIYKYKYKYIYICIYIYIYVYI